MQCHATPCGQNEKHFLPFCVLLNVGIDPNFPQKRIFFWLYSEKNFAFQQKHF